MELKYWMLLFVAIISLTYSTIAVSKSRKKLSVYWGWRCNGRQWKARFPEASKEDIREFLEIFVGAFLFDENHALVFAPEAKVMDIYQALYPPEFAMPDALETETFAKEVKVAYGVDLVSIWRDDDITLGEIFERICCT
jgi:propanediol dehydratase small subunit